MCIVAIQGNDKVNVLFFARKLLDITIAVPSIVYHLSWSS